MLARNILIAIMLIPTDSAALDFFDDFDDGNLDGWECADDCDNWFVSCGDGNGAAFSLLPFEPQVASSIYPSNREWNDVQIDLDMRGIVGKEKIVHFRVSDTGQVFYGVDITLDEIGFGKIGAAGESWTPLDQAAFLNENGTWYHLTIRAVGGHITILVDGVEYINYVDSEPVAGGSVWLRGYVAVSPSSVIQWDNVSIIELGGTADVPDDGFVRSTWGGIKAQHR